MNFRKLFQPDPEKYSVSRIEALSDGVFSITMTLLILSVQVPPLSPDDKTTIHKLLQVLPVLENYFISFIVLGLFWVRHQMQFREIRTSDRNLMWINIFFLMFVAIIPFTTSMMVEYSNNHISIQVYCFNLIILGVILIIHWEYAIRNHRLIDDNLNLKELRSITKVQILTPAMFFFTAVLAFFDITVAKMSLYVLPLISAISIKTYRRIRRKHISE
ncbi:MAG: DUF1211 domain-containing protein [Ignavibacteriae bacterium]|nr:DUF1211 domain-containing protein [Ignavibacteriota bacterium]MCB0724282.1 DUF1211 domain-containing protein [Ignavibacteriota bacterium]MCB9243674.1 DUF1211 domain-containing protein [Ignavibacteriales bacterium]